MNVLEKPWFSLNHAFYGVILQLKIDSSVQPVLFVSGLDTVSAAVP